MISTFKSHFLLFSFFKIWFMHSTGIDLQKMRNKIDLKKFRQKFPCVKEIELSSRFCCILWKGKLENLTATSGVKILYIFREKIT